jgi:effector-binding domain-containing protein
VPSANLDRLAAFVQETGLHLSQESLEQLMPANNSTPKQKELVGTLQITFVHNEPDLLREVPAVPG